jgi:hypothetical protein
MEVGVCCPKTKLPSSMWYNLRGRGKKIKKCNMRHNHNPRIDTLPYYTVPLTTLDVA